jgi:hypothetical protein
MCEHSLGHAKESRHALEEVIAKHAQGYAYAIAQASWRGEKDNAFAWLERAFQQRAAPHSLVIGRQAVAIVLPCFLPDR